MYIVNSVYTLKIHINIIIISLGSIRHIANKEVESFNRNIGIKSSVKLQICHHAL